MNKYEKNVSVTSKMWRQHAVQKKEKSALVPRCIVFKVVRLAPALHCLIWSICFFHLPYAFVSVPKRARNEIYNILFILICDVSFFVF